MINENELLLKETEDLLLEIQQLKKQLEYESQKHKPVSYTHLDVYKRQALL